MIAAEEHRGQGRPAEDQPEGQAGHEVEHQVHAAGPAPKPRSEPDQLLGGVLEAEQEQEQDDADLGSDLDELVGGGEVDRAPVPQEQPGHEEAAGSVRGRSRSASRAMSPRASSTPPISSRVDERPSRRRRGSPGPRPQRRSPARGAEQPRRGGDAVLGAVTSTTVSPGCSSSSGPGAGTAPPSRMTAITDEPVRVRISVLAIVIGVNVGGRGSQSMNSPSISAESAAQLGGDAGAAEQLGHRRALGRGQLDAGRRRRRGRPRRRRRPHGARSAGR